MGLTKLTFTDDDVPISALCERVEGDQRIWLFVEPVASEDKKTTVVNTAKSFTNDIMVLLYRCEFNPLSSEPKIDFRILYKFLRESLFVSEPFYLLQIEQKIKASFSFFIHAVL